MDPEREGTFRFHFHSLQHQQAQFLGLSYDQGNESFWIPAALALDLLKAALRQTWVHARLARSFADPAPGVPIGQVPLQQLEAIRKPLAAYDPRKRAALRMKRNRRRKA